MRHASHAGQHRAFTLIELLVVITLLVILISLLAPALDQAIYQAELAVCGANLRTQASGTLRYASDHKRRYPNRPMVDGDDVRADYLTFFSRLDRPVYNDRPKLAPYMSLNKTFNCPQSQPIDLEAPGPDDPYILFTGYARYYGWAFRVAGGSAFHKGMRKVGDRFEYSFVGSGGAAEDAAFSLLATDADFYGGNTFHSSHADQSGLLSPVRFEDHPQTNVRGQYFISFSYWYTDSNRGEVTRGRVDRNFVYQDHSVHRINDIAVDDPRLVRISSHSSTAVNRDTFLPVR